MPELPEVETVRRTILPHVIGRCVCAVQVHQTRLRELVNVVQLRDILLQQKFLAVRRRAKYLLFDLSSSDVLLVHLGMSGHLGVMPSKQLLRRHDHVVLQLDNGVDLRFNDARRFGLVTGFAQAKEATHPRLAHLGVEPLDAQAFHGAKLHQATRGVAKPIKNFLMDATQQVGVGNIYASEALFLARVHPRRAAGRLSLATCHRLVTAVREVLDAAITQGGTSLRDFADPNGRRGYFRLRLQVYGRAGKPCNHCAQPLKKLLQAGRSTIYCSRCQH